jgi:muconolactone delta-isomerase
MEFMVTMTTSVPAGTTEDDVADMRAREAARSRVLAADGYLLRLWRPPLRPGEWRTLGLFAAEDVSTLDDVLRSMPLRAWRTDSVIALGPHPNDPAARPARPRPGGAEHLTHFRLSIPRGTSIHDLDRALGREAEQARVLAAKGHLVRLWTLPSERDASGTLGLWRARSRAELDAVLDALPLRPWLTVDTLPLAPHPNDPLLSTPLSVA